MSNLERIPTMLDIINVLECFAPVFSARVWQHAKILLVGAILCRKERTVAAILRVMGLGNDPHFVNYHRVLSKARWSGLQAAKILLGLLVALVPVNWPVIIGVDDTIERRKGKKIGLSQSLEKLSGEIWNCGG